MGYTHNIVVDEKYRSTTFFYTPGDSFNPDFGFIGIVDNNDKLYETTQFLGFDPNNVAIDAESGKISGAEVEVQYVTSQGTLITNSINSNFGGIDIPTNVYIQYLNANFARFDTILLENKLTVSTLETTSISTDGILTNVLKADTFIGKNFIDVTGAKLSNSMLQNCTYIQSGIITDNTIIISGGNLLYGNTIQSNIFTSGEITISDNYIKFEQENNEIDSNLTYLSKTRLNFNESTYINTSGYKFNNNVTLEDGILYGLSRLYIGDNDIGSMYLEGKNIHNVNNLYVQNISSLQNLKFGTSTTTNINIFTNTNTSKIRFNPSDASYIENVQYITGVKTLTFEKDGNNSIHNLNTLNTERVFTDTIKAPTENASNTKITLGEDITVVSEKNINFSSENEASLMNIDMKCELNKTTTINADVEISGGLRFKNESDTTIGFHDYFFASEAGLEGDILLNIPGYTKTRGIHLEQAQFDEDPDPYDDDTNFLNKWWRIEVHNPVTYQDAVAPNNNSDDADEWKGDNSDIWLGHVYDELFGVTDPGTIGSFDINDDINKFTYSILLIKPNFEYPAGMDPDTKIDFRNDQHGGFAFHLDRYEIGTGFTGKHFSILNSPVIPGMIVKSTGTYFTINESPTISLDSSWVKSTPSTKSYEKSVFGVVSQMVKKKKIDGVVQYELKYQGAPMNLYIDDKNGDTLYEINSLGEGAILVCSENGSIENGDYICTSNLEGIGMKQTGHQLCNYTVAKATCDCDFNNLPKEIRHTTITHNNTTYIVALIGCTYHCG